MKILAAAERATYEEMWSVPAYSAYAPGETHVSTFLEMSGARWGTLLDAGCGTGRGGLALEAKGFRVTYADLTDQGLDASVPRERFRGGSLWGDLLVSHGRYDYVYSCDVLEHLPREFTMLTVARLLEVSRRGAFFSVSVMRDECGMWVGKPLHQTVQHFTWWRDRFAELGTLKESRDCLSFGLYWVEP